VERFKFDKLQVASSTVAIIQKHLLFRSSTIASDHNPHLPTTHPRTHHSHADMVKLTIKTVQNKVFNVEAGENESIADVKNKIKDAQGFAVEAQKIIYAGE
jgi:hypothetical protein